MKKPLRYLVIHCTATPEGRQVSSEEIRRWHIAPKEKGGRGWKQVGYTDMIHLNGEVERLVANNEDEWVDPWEITNGAKGYNGRSRHMVYVGGLASDAKTPKDTRTREQLDSMRDYVLKFHSKHPKVKIIGHKEIANKACPCFDVQEWLLSIGINQK
jgi:hypothetical protein